MQDGLYRQRPRIARPLFFEAAATSFSPFDVASTTSVQATAKMLLCDNDVIRGDALDFHHVPAHLVTGAFH
ncbi:hypothetical protein XarjCFBP8253_05535 [Xanthomonas arboricola pv. juglandis]|nr:hypothetical protein XarjCFBP8253_05535 [Xanthomonas arboricola pv. juglandis]PPU16715.1 hypothetical protein XacyCFBP2565_04710 [Xanthomonas arboricola pv. corylina]PPU61669.1 hypothetical protein XacyCFBP1159_07470 [Xanthomonas arboricola pv. corylina]